MAGVVVVVGAAVGVAVVVMVAVAVAIAVAIAVGDATRVGGGRGPGPPGHAMSGQYGGITWKQAGQIAKLATTEEKQRFLDLMRIQQIGDAFGEQAMIDEAVEAARRLARKILARA